MICGSDSPQANTGMTRDDAQAPAAETKLWVTVCRRHSKVPRAMRSLSGGIDEVVGRSPMLSTLIEW